MFVSKWKYYNLLDEIDLLFDQVSELSALVEFLVEKQEKTKKAATATKKVASTGRTKKA